MCVWGGGGGVSALFLPENNAQISQSPLKYFLVLPKINLLLLPKSLKVIQLLLSFLNTFRSGGGVVDNTLDYQSRDRKLDPPLHRSFGRDFKPRSRLRMTSLLVGR